MPDIYDALSDLYDNALTDLAILAGDQIGPSDASWQDVAGTAAVNLRMLADQLDSLRTGKRVWRGCPLTGPVVFPSPAEVLGD